MSLQLKQGGGEMDDCQDAESGGGGGGKTCGGEKRMTTSDGVAHDVEMD